MGQNGAASCPASATPSEPVAAESSTPPTEARRSRWPWVIGLGTAAASLCVALIAVGVIIGRGNDTGSTHAAALSRPSGVLPEKRRPPNAITIPRPSRRSGRVVPRRRQSRTADLQRLPRPATTKRQHLVGFPNCVRTQSCAATGALLDDADHAKLSAAGGQKPVVLDFRNGAWQSRPETMLFACLGPDGTPAKQTTTQVIWLQHAHGALRGTMTVTVESNECSQQGATIEIPAVAARVAEVPPGVEVPGPPSDTPPAPAKTTPPAD